MKGQMFEREFCKMLSLWFTDGKRDDIFWRTAGSGARATMRAKMGKKTINSAGDVSAIDPEGEAFLSDLIIELKTGYKVFKVTDLLGNSLLMKWIRKLKKEAYENGKRKWWLVHRNRNTIVFFNQQVYDRDLDYDPGMAIGSFILDGNGRVYFANFVDFIQHIKRR